MKKIFLICLIFGMATMSFAQISNLKSKVVEKGTAIAVEGAVVAINGTTLAKTTNKEGEFVIKNIPLGEQIVTVTKKGYETKFFILNIEKGYVFKVDKIEFTVTKKLKKERKKLKKKHEKELEDRLKKVKKETAKIEKDRKKLKKELLKQREKELKEIAKAKAKKEKEAKAIKFDESIKIDYTQIDKPNDTQTTSTNNVDIDVNIVEPVSETQLKYAKILGIDSSYIINTELYEFIDRWAGTTYLNGGETEDGIDCSSFTQRLYTKIYDNYIERTSEKQFNSRFTDKFKDKTVLKEGDLLFFKSFNDPNNISHVGIYLQNDRFVHSTSSKAKSGLSGVQISNLTEPKWAQRFVAGGRRLSSGN